MQVTRTEQVIVEQKVLEQVICNCCGKPVQKIKYSEYDYKSIHLNVNFNDASELFSDGETHSLDICEKCYAKFIQTFKYAPTGFGQTVNDYSWGMESDIAIDSDKEFEVFKTKQIDIN